MDYISSNYQPVSVEDVYRGIRNRILNLELEPGQKISENQMCEEYNVSRSIIRNVFTRLNQLELLNIYPQRGTYVSLIDLNYIEDLLILRTAVEKEVLYEMFTKIEENNRRMLAEELEKNLVLQEKYKDMKIYDENFKKLDSMFHKIMIDSVKRYRLVEILKNPMLHIDRWRNLDVAAIEGRMPQLVEEHRDIANGIKENSLDKAQAATMNHLETISKAAGRAKEKFPQYFTE